MNPLAELKKAFEDPTILGVVNDTSGLKGEGVPIFVQDAEDGFILTQKLEGSNDQTQVIYMSEDMTETLLRMLGQLLAYKQKQKVTVS